MVRHFCDCCGTEIESRNSLLPCGDEHIIGLAKVEMRTPRTFNPYVLIRVHNRGGEWASGQLPKTEDICVYCVLDAIARLDDRAKEA